MDHQIGKTRTGPPFKLDVFTLLCKFSCICNFCKFDQIFMKFSPKCRNKKLGMIYTIFGSFCSPFNWEGAVIWLQSSLGKSLQNICICGQIIILYFRDTVDENKLARNIHIVAEALARHIYNLTSQGNVQLFNEALVSMNRK